MSTSPRALSPGFIPSVNALLVAFALPFAIDDPTDLTPSLLLAIFESLIGARLPIPQTVRQSRTRDAKSRAMLVLLGVLECDVLRGGADPDASLADDSVLGGVSVDGWVDEIGLGDVDPERLADGGWEETIFVGELLCWLARRKGVLPRTKPRSSNRRSFYSGHHSYGTDDTADFSSSLLLRPSSSRRTLHDDSVIDVPRHPLVHSPEPSLSVSPTIGTDLSIRARTVSSRTSVSNPSGDPDVTQDTYSHRMMQDAEDDEDRPPTFRPHCIHELEDPSYIQALAKSFESSALHDPVSEDEDDPYRGEEDAPPTPTPQRVRLTGSIDSVDPASELDYFAASRPRSRAFHGNTHSDPSSLSPYTRLEGPSGSSAETRHPAHTTRRISPSPSPPPLPTSSKRSTPRLRSNSPPSPTTSDPPFDLSFSTPNNTSTPAKPRPQRRPPLQAPARHPIDTGTRRSLSSTPPSFATPGNQRSGSATVAGSSGMSIKSPTALPAGSTLTTKTLLTERARLLTELAALKRARAASGGGTSNPEVGVASSSRRVGVGV